MRTQEKVISKTTYLKKIVLLKGIEEDIENIEKTKWRFENSGKWEICR